MKAKNNYFSRGQAEEFAEILKALGHPLRLQLADILSNEKLCVGDLSKRIGMAQALISQQLKILRMVNLVKSEKLHGYSYYSLSKPRLKELLRCLRKCKKE